MNIENNIVQRFCKRTESFFSGIGTEGRKAEGKDRGKGNQYNSQVISDRNVRVPKPESGQQVRKDLRYHFIKSLILAQDERWRRA